MSRLDVNIVVVAYDNDPEHVRSLVCGLITAGASQHLTVEATIVVNDDTRYRETPGVQVLAGHGNVGFARGVALGVAARVSRYVVIVNPDCVVDSSSAAATFRHLRPGCGILVPILEDAPGCLDVDIYLAWVFTPVAKVSRMVCRRFLRRSDSMIVPRLMKAPGAFMALETALATELGGPFDRSFYLYGEDRDLTFRARDRGVEIRIMRDVRVLHPGGGSGGRVSRLVARSQGDGMLRVAYRRYGNLGLRLMCANLSLEALVKDALRGTQLRADRQWAIARWASTRPAQPLTEADFPESRIVSE